MSYVKGDWGFIDSFEMRISAGFPNRTTCLNRFDASERQAKEGALNPQSPLAAGRRPAGVEKR